MEDLICDAFLVFAKKKGEQRMVYAINQNSIYKNKEQFLADLKNGKITRKMIQENSHELTNVSIHEVSSEEISKNYNDIRKNAFTIDELNADPKDKILYTTTQMIHNFYNGIINENELKEKIQKVFNERMGVRVADQTQKIKAQQTQVLYDVYDYFQRANTRSVTMRINNQGFFRGDTIQKRITKTDNHAKNLEGEVGEESSNKEITNPKIFMERLKKNIEQQIILGSDKIKKSENESQNYNFRFLPKESTFVTKEEKESKNTMGLTVQQDMLLSETIKATFPKLEEDEDGNKKDKTYGIVMDEHGIRCCEQGATEYEWEIVFSDESQFKKAMDRIDNPLIPDKNRTLEERNARAKERQFYDALLKKLEKL